MPDPITARLGRQVLLKETHRPRPSILCRLRMIAVGVGIVVERVLCARIHFHIEALAGLCHCGLERLNAWHNVGIVFSVIAHDGARNIRYGFQRIGIPAVVDHRSIEVFTFGGEV